MTTQTESHIKHHPDDWSFTSKFHHHVERTVHPVIVELVKWATHTLPPSSSSTVLDDGCGLGTVTAEIKKSFPDLSVLAIDSSAGMLEVVERKAKKHDWKNVETKLLDGGDLSGIFTFPHPSQPTSHSDPPYIARNALPMPTPNPITSLAQPGSLMAIFSAGCNPTSPLLSTLLIVLARNPHIWQRLHDGISQLQARKPTLDEPKAMKYLGSCLH